MAFFVLYAIRATPRRRKRFQQDAILALQALSSSPLRLCPKNPYFCSMNNLTAIGKLQKTFGAHGELMLALYDDFSLPQSAPLFITVDGLSVPFYLKSAEEKGSKYVVVFDDMESEKRAAELVGKEVMAELSARQQRRHAAGSGSAAPRELMGYKVVDKALGELGLVGDWLDYPGNPCLQILNPQGQEIIIPANEDFIISVDGKEKILTVDLPQGLVEIYLEADKEIKK